MAMAYAAKRMRGWRHTYMVVPLPCVSGKKCLNVP